MKLPYRDQWVLASLSVLLTSFVVLGVEVSGGYPPYILSTLVIFTSGSVLLINNSVFSFGVMGFVIIFFPALTPAYVWTFRGKELFSMAAQNLQYDVVLVDKAVFLFAVAAITYAALVAPRYPQRPRKIAAANRHIAVSGSLLFVVAVLTIISGIVIETGPTILTADYGTVLSSRLARTSFVVFMVMIFGGLWGFLFAFGRDRKYLFWGVTIFVSSWLFLHSRRVEVFGIALVLILWGQYRLKRIWLALLIGIFLMLQGAVGLVRHQGVIEYLAEPEGGEQMVLEKAALPGGASNIFLSGLHLVNVRDWGMLEPHEQFTMSQWPRSLIPNIILKGLGSSPVKPEHQSIYDELGLDYVGGMPLLGVYYLNGGIIMVMIYGLVHGFLARQVGQIIGRELSAYYVRGGTLTLFVATVFLVYQFRYHWYNPLTMFRAIEFALLMAVTLSVFAKLRGGDKGQDLSRQVNNKLNS